LVADSLHAYEDLAIEIATTPGRSLELKQRLQQNRLAAPLFNTARFARNLEAAYTAMYERNQSGLRPEHLYIENQPDR